MSGLGFRFYVDVAKFFFSAAAGSTAGYLLVKGINSGASRVAPLAEAAVVTRFGDDSEVIDVTNDSDD